MSYQVLARKLRPADFDGLVGQNHIVRALRHGLDAGRLHHAYLFTGTRGVGKTTIARILARCLNCEQGVSATPCGECGICREVQENRFVDLIEVDAASRTRVDDTRELLDNAQYLPARGRYKIYLIDEVHMLSTSSFNALLKTLEEPPEHVKFLLATTDPKKVPITVLSRCLQFQLKSISQERIAAYLADAMTDEGIAFERDALDLIGKAARGSMRDALSITDQAVAFGQGRIKTADVAELLGAVGRDEVAAIIDAVETGRPDAVLRVSQALAERGADFDAVLAELLQALHDVAVAKALQEDDARPGLGAETVQLHYQIALMGYRDLRVAPDAKTAFEMTLLRMLAFAPDVDSAVNAPAAQRGAPARGARPSARSAAVPGDGAQPAAGGAAALLPQGSQPRPPAAEPRSRTSSEGRTRPEKPRPAPQPQEPQPASSAAEPRSRASSEGRTRPEKPRPVPQPQEPQPASSAAEPRSRASSEGRTGPEEPRPALLPQGSQPGPSVAEPRSRASSEGRTRPQEPQPAPSAAEAPHQQRGSPREALAAEWCDLVSRLKLNGLGKAIVERAILLEKGGDLFRLRLDQSHYALLRAQENAAIAQALSAALGRSVSVQVEEGVLDCECPAVRRERLEAERNAQAKREFAQDSLVSALLTQLGGQVLEAKYLESH